jgi:hypothetical protein
VLEPPVKLLVFVEFPPVLYVAKAGVAKQETATAKEMRYSFCEVFKIFPLRKLKEHY